MATKHVRRLDASGDFTFGRGLANYARGTEATKQRLVCRIRLILGEYPLDTSKGVPWYQDEDSDTRPIMGGKADLPYAEATVKAAILGTDGIASLESFTMALDHVTRRLAVAATVVDVDGGEISFTVVSP